MKAARSPAVAPLMSLLGLALLCSAACSRQPPPPAPIRPAQSSLDKIRQTGAITVVTRAGPATYYLENAEERGFSFELADRFADHLEVSLNVIVAKSDAEMIEILREGKADFAAASLINQSLPDSRMTLVPTHQWLTFHLIYRNGGELPTSLDDIPPHAIHIAGDYLPPPLVESLRANHPKLLLVIHPELNTQDLLAMIEKGEIGYTIADSNELVLAMHSYPEIRPALTVGTPLPLAWAFRGEKVDAGLIQAAREFQDEIYLSGDLADLFDACFGHTEEFDYLDSRNFIDRYAMRLPNYRDLFEKTADQYRLDWSLLAAISYQESHWDRTARSETGVRGLMMLTKSTAESLGVTNRADPVQSIRGGAEYFTHMLEKIPERIQEPDRRWFALAAYNIGYGHLEDARVLTDRMGKNPDLWEDVRESLPLLSRKKWFRTTRHGYARGYQAVEFVENIRKYHNTLVQLTQPEMAPYERSVENLYSDSKVL
ncbi:MAG: membrane-bound lytic murein transglycosylase MltF [Gammaproteobacteria bacterium]|nr:MAG: membrane-bound lytic murein transglycosylase MltF [Gammaproteobacteria bacterium]